MENLCQPSFSTAVDRTRAQTLNDRLFFFLATGITAWTLGVLLLNTRYLNLADASTARRGLLLLGATDEKWSFTLAYALIWKVTALWAENLFHLKVGGIFLVALASLLFSCLSIRILSEANQGLKALTLFIAGLGVYGYNPNSLPEYNQLACLSALLITATVVHLYYRSSLLTLPSIFFLGFFFGLFLATNLPSATALFILFSVYWYLQSKAWQEIVKLLAIGLIAVATFALLWKVLNDVSLGSVNPGVRYNEIALNELSFGSLRPSNLLYLLLRLLTFSAELFILIPAFLGAYFLGKTGRNKRINFQRGLLSLPFVWFLVSTFFTYLGFETFQTPDLWDFSPAFFWGKFVWYGHATLFPLLAFVGLFLGLYPLDKIPKSKMLLIAFLGSMVLAGCFGSGARVVHKAYLYEWSLVLILLWLMENVKNQRELRSVYQSLFLLVVCHFFFIQTLPFLKTGGMKSYHFSLNHLPRGKDLLVQREFADWINPLHDLAVKSGLKTGDKVLSNDYLALYLLGLSHATLESPKECCSFGLLSKKVTNWVGESKVSHSSLLKIFGPPHLEKAIEEKESVYEEVLKEMYSPIGTLNKGKTSQTILLRKVNG